MLYQDLLVFIADFAKLMYTQKVNITYNNIGYFGLALNNHNEKYYCVYNNFNDFVSTFKSSKRKLLCMAIVNLFSLEFVNLSKNEYTKLNSLKNTKECLVVIDVYNVSLINNKDIVLRSDPLDSKPTAPGLRILKRSLNFDKLLPYRNMNLIDTFDNRLELTTINVKNVINDCINRERTEYKLDNKNEFNQEDFMKGFDFDYSGGQESEVPTLDIPANASNTTTSTSTPVSTINPTTPTQPTVPNVPQQTTQPQAYSQPQPMMQNMSMNQNPIPMGNPMSNQNMPNNMDYNNMRNQYPQQPMVNNDPYNAQNMIPPNGMNPNYPNNYPANNYPNNYPNNYSMPNNMENPYAAPNNGMNAQANMYYNGMPVQGNMPMPNNGMYVNNGYMNQPGYEQYPNNAYPQQNYQNMQGQVYPNSQMMQSQPLSAYQQPVSRSMQISELQQSQYGVNPNSNSVMSSVNKSNNANVNASTDMVRLKRQKMLSSLNTNIFDEDDEPEETPKKKKRKGLFG